MNILDAITNRHALRAFDPDRKIDRTMLRRCVEAAHLAPSYANKQGWRWIVVDEEPSLTAVRTSLTAGNYWALKAPVLAALVTDEKWTATASGNRAYAPFGAGLSAMNFMTQATVEGLIAHPMAGFDPDIAKQALGIPEEHICMLLVSVGWKGDEAGLKENHLAMEHAERVRLPIERILAWNGWTDELENLKP